MPTETSGTAHFRGYVKQCEITVNMSFSLLIGIMKWNMETIFRRENDEEMLNVEVIGRHKYESSTFWNCDTHIELKIKKKDGTEEPIGARDCYFDYDSLRFIFKTPLKKDVLLADKSEYVIDSIVTVNAYIRIKSSSGIEQSKEADFSIPNNIDSEVTLILENDQKLYIDKYILMAFSSVFRAMFSSDYRESLENQVEIKDVKYENLVAFLRILNHQEQKISDENVKGLLALADRYDVQFLVKKCEDFLVLSPHISNIRKLQIAEMYRFAKLQDSVFNDLSKKSERDESFSCQVIQKLSL